MLDYKVGRYVHINNLNKQRKITFCSPKFIKRKFFLNGDMDKLKARLVAYGANKEDTLSSASISFQVVFMLFNIVSYHRRMLQTVDIRGAFLNAEFTCK